VKWTSELRMLLQGAQYNHLNAVFIIFFLLSGCKEKLATSDGFRIRSEKYHLPYFC
jgi:hypothetical protein